MKPLASFAGRAAVLNVNDIDTDQIIPARFLTTAEKTGLGGKLFYDWRYDAAGAPVAGFVLNRPGQAGAAILVGGHNFGCGSSREHAAWALRQHGFQAVISTSFADIFRQNAVKNQLVPIALVRREHAHLLAVLARQPDAELTVDLVTRSLGLPGGESFTFPIDPFARQCLLSGWDEIEYVLAQEDAIRRYEERRDAPSAA